MARSSPIVTLTTDFGLRDNYVGQMKGRILGRCPSAIVVDLAHGIPAQNIISGAYLLGTGVDAFPEGTIHVAVVDPGVGTARAPLVVRGRRFLFVAPDNGLLTLALTVDPPLAVHRIDPAALDAGPLSRTFHGRDLFAPAAAVLAAGAGPSALGPRMREIVRLDQFAAPPRGPGPLDLEVVHVDRFGNAVLPLRREEVAAGGGPAWRAETAGGIAAGLHGTFADGPRDEPFLLVNSAGFLEIVLRDGSAAERLGLKCGAGVRLWTAGSPG